jgi:hypothetical protein
MSDSRETERSVMRRKREVVWLGALLFPLGLQCLRREESTENCEVSLNLSVITYCVIKLHSVSVIIWNSEV